MLKLENSHQALPSFRNIVAFEKLRRALRFRTFRHNQNRFARLDRGKTLQRQRAINEIHRLARLQTLELTIVNWHCTLGCFTTLLPVVFASHCTTISMFAP